MLAASIVVLMMEAASSSETSANVYQTTRRKNPEDSHLHTRRRENLKSYWIHLVQWRFLVTLVTIRVHKRPPPVSFLSHMNPVISHPVPTPRLAFSSVLSVSFISRNDA
jgi:hypothetical protein